VKQPVDSTTQTETGKIYITSEPSGATIFMDGENTLQLTPDTLSNIPVGEHFFSVYKEGYSSAIDSFTIEIKKDSLARMRFVLDEITFIGSLALISDPAGAEIFVDNQSTGAVTPDTIRVEAGTHNIVLKKNGFVDQEWQTNVSADTLIEDSRQMDVRQCVLMESFGNVSCVPCVESAENLEKFRSEHNEAGYALLEYYANWPSANDPFYLVSPKDVDERVMYYSVFSLPTLKMNGTTGVDAKDYAAIENNYGSLLTAQNTELGLSISRNFANDSVYVNVEVYDYKNYLSNNQLRLFVLFTEDEIHMDAAPGANGLKDFNFVFRGFLTEKIGIELTSDRFSFRHAWSVNWQYSQSHVIGFIQDISTRQIIQATIN
jgi:hypothetical protein